MAVELVVRLKSIDDYVKRRHGRVRALTPNEQGQIFRYADRMLEYIKSRWPVDTGTSRDRWTYELDPSPGRMAIRIENPMFYAEYVHHRGGSPERPLWETLVPEAFGLIKDPMLTAVRNQIDLTERAIERRKAQGVGERRALLDIFSNPELSEVFGGLFGV
jgi:hypothetical protein